jgi:DNA-binding transcriptional LysR family regulator
VGIPPTIPAYCCSELVYQDRFVVIAARRLKIGRMTLARYVAMAHVENALFGEVDDDIDRRLAEVGLEREVRAAVPHLSLLPSLVAASDLIATVAEELVYASRVAPRLDVFSPPLKIPPLRFTQVWHQRSDADPGHQMFRALVRDMARRHRRAPRVSARRVSAGVP